MENNIKITDKPYTDLAGGFFIVPNNFGLVMSAIGLKPNDRLIYLTMLRFANNSGNPFPSYKKIKEYTGISSDNTVSSSIKRLEESGLIEKIHRGTTQGDSNVYKVNYAYLGEPIEKPSQPKVIKQPKKQPQRANKSINEELGVDIPFKRGTHDSIVTSTEAKQRLAEVENNDWESKLIADMNVLDRI